MQSDRDGARTDQCPLCGDDAVGVIEPGESRRTPSQIDDQWKICVTGDGVYVHDIGVNDWGGRFD